MDKLKTIVFWGACWGMVEASLGWFLHLVHLKNELLVLYPFGLMCMLMAAKQTGQASAVIKTAGIAALIKLSNLLAPTAVPVYYVANPAAAIVLEGLVAWGFYSYARKYSFRWTTALPAAFVAVFVSMLLFSGWQVLMHGFAHNPNASQVLDAALAAKWARVSLVEGAILTVGVWLANRIPATTADFAKWTQRLSMPALCASILLTIWI